MGKKTSKKEQRKGFVKTTKEDRQRRGKRKPSHFISLYTIDRDAYKMDDENIIRLLPRTEAKAEWLKDDMLSSYGIFGFLHYGVGKSEKNKYGFTFFCIDKMLGKDCPVCEDGDEPTERLFAYCLNREKEKDGAQIINMPVSVDNEIYEQSRNRKTGQYYPIEDIEEGKDVVFQKAGKGMKTKYSGFKLEDVCPLDNEDAEDFVVKKPIADIFRFYSYEEIKSKLYGGVKDSSSSEDVEYDLEELREMSTNRLGRVIKKLNIDVDEDDDKEDLIEAICKELDIEYEFASEEDEDDSNDSEDEDEDSGEDDSDSDDEEDSEDDGSDDEEDDEDEEEWKEKIRKAKLKKGKKDKK